MSFEERTVISVADDCSPLDNFLESRTRISGGGNPVLAQIGAGATWRSASWSDRLTRAFDFTVALLVLIAVAPTILLLILIQQADSPGPVFFIQRRIGKNGIMFPCIKLRTMVTRASDRLEQHLRECPEARREWNADHKLKVDPRITRMGALARRYSLDELPQLVNILVGQMSIVGPRPIVEAEVWRYGSSFADYCSVRPGLTGLWQVSGRNNTTYEERVRLDRQYARSKSFLFDLQIILRTFSAVISARGAH